MMPLSSPNIPESLANFKVFLIYKNPTETLFLEKYMSLRPWCSQSVNL